MKTLDKKDKYHINEGVNGLNARLKDLRYQQTPHITQQEVAEKLDLSQSNINDYEKDGYYVPPLVLAKYAKAFNVTSDYLLGLSSTRNPSNIDVQDLRLSEKALEKLKNQKIGSEILSEIIENPLFTDLIIDAFIYVQGFVDVSYSQYNTVTGFYWKNVMNGTKTGDNEDEYYNYHLRDGSWLNQDIYFSGVFTEKFLSILRDLRKPML